MSDPIAVEVNGLLDELNNSFLPMLDESTEVCSSMLVRKGHNKHAVLRLFESKEKNGELVWRWALWEGKKVKAYRKA